MIRKRNNRLGYLLISPYIVAFLILFLIPLIWSIWLSVTDWNMISPNYNIVGLQNFIDAFNSKAVHAAFWATYKFMIILLPLVVFLSLGIALLVNKLPAHKGLYLVGFFLPYLSSGVVTSLIVKGMLSYNAPLSTYLKQTFHMNVDWFSRPWVSIFIVALMIAWKMSGYYALILFSGLNNINHEIYEAADIDGASNWAKFTKITLPLLYPSLLTVIILAVGLNFGIFTEVFKLTSGGPDMATNVWQMEIYNQAFVNLKSGYASSVAILASIATFITIGIVRKVLETWGKSNGFE